MKNDFDKICKAAFEGNLDQLKLLLKNKVELNQKGEFWTPLHSAIENENLDCLKLLLDKGADVEFIGTDGEGFPLDHAVDISVQVNINTGGKEGEENLDIINALLEAGANPKTGIQTAKNYGATKILEKLNSYL
ncbi:hypothetical protein CW732_10540 [Olleya sp. Bg11-27]|nr:hypothetical protein CW732_10540 [Olleya sp. Bg11-27]